MEQSHETTVRILEDAADLLEGRWVAGTWSRYDEELGQDRVCVVEALHRVSMDEERECIWLAEVEILQALGFDRKQIEQLWRTADMAASFLVRWNDELVSGEQEVLDLLRKASKRVQGVDA